MQGDETCTTTAMVRLRGRAPRGERLVDYAPHGHWKTITFVGGLWQRGMTAPFVLEGAMNGPMFLAYVKQCLVPTPQARRDRADGPCRRRGGDRSSGRDVVELAFSYRRELSRHLKYMTRATDS